MCFGSGAGWEGGGRKVIQSNGCDLFSVTGPTDVFSNEGHDTEKRVEKSNARKSKPRE